MHKRLFLLTCFVLSLCFSFAQGEKRLALIIGNSQYSSGELKNAVNDANKVSAKLKTLGFDVILKNNATNQMMGEAINDFTNKASSYDVALFYYAGHGIQSEGSNYLIPVNDNMIEKESDIEYNSQNVNRILRRLEDSGCKLKILILDACRNNPFERSWHRSMSSSGLVALDAPDGTLIAYATNPGSVADDGGNAQNSPYTTAFLQTLDKTDLSIFEFFNEVGGLVRRNTNNKQTPWVSTSPIEGNFKFNQAKVEENKKVGQLTPSSSNLDGNNDQPIIVGGKRSVVFNLSPSNAIIRFHDGTTCMNGDPIFLKVGERYSYIVEAEGFQVVVGSFDVEKDLPGVSIDISLPKSNTKAITISELSRSRERGYLSSTLEKVHKKEVGFLLKEFNKKAGWVINDSLRSLEDALLTHVRLLTETGAFEIVGKATQFKQMDIGKGLARNDAYVKYISEREMDIALARGNVTVESIDEMCQGSSFTLEEDELIESFSVIRKIGEVKSSGESIYEMVVFFLCKDYFSDNFKW